MPPDENISKLVAEFVRLNARLKEGQLSTVEQLRWQHLRDSLVEAQQAGTGASEAPPIRRV